MIFFGSGRSASGKAFTVHQMIRIHVSFTIAFVVVLQAARLKVVALWSHVRVFLDIVIITIVLAFIVAIVVESPPPPLPPAFGFELIT